MGDTLYVHTSMIKFRKDDEPEMAFVMRSSRFIAEWSAEIRDTFGEANVRKIGLPMGNTGWAIPYAYEAEARSIADHHFDEILDERPGLIGDREEPQACESEGPEPVEELVVQDYVLTKVGHADAAAFGDAAIIIVLAGEDQKLHLKVGLGEAKRCAALLFEGVELVIRKK